MVRLLCPTNEHLGIAAPQLFADITARRKELETRYALLKDAHSSPKERKSEACTDRELMLEALKDAAIALTDEEVFETEKRILLGTVVEKVLPHKEGADVIFAFNILHTVEGEDNMDNRSSRETFHTICMGISTQR